MNKYLLAALFSTSFAMAAQAQTQVPGAYLGVNVGSAEQKLSVDGESAKKDKTGFKLYGGYGFTQNFGVEAGYVHFGKYSESYTNGRDSGSLSFRSQAFYVAGTAAYPVNDQFSLFAKAGLSANRAKASVTVNGERETDSATNTAAMFGLGAQYKFTRNLSVVAEYEDFGKVVDEGDGHVKAKMFSAGVRYHF